MTATVFLRSYPSQWNLLGIVLQIEPEFICAQYLGAHSVKALSPVNKFESVCVFDCVCIFVFMCLCMIVFVCLCTLFGG